MQSDMNTVINKDYMLMRIFLQPFPLFSIFPLLLNQYFFYLMPHWGYDTVNICQLYMQILFLKKVVSKNAAYNHLD